MGGGDLFTPQVIELLRGLKNVLGKGSLLAYLVHMTLRVTEIHRVLKPTGSFYLHCDPTASHYLKLILDAIFIPLGGDYLNDIIWQRTNNPKGSQFKAKKYGIYTDNIFFYCKKIKEYYFELDQAKILLSKKELERKYNKVDRKGRYYEGPIECGPSMGNRPNLCFEYKGYRNRYPSGWRLSKEKLIDLDVKGDIGWNEKGRPFRKLRPENDKGSPISNLWNDIDRLYAGKERLGYPTQKPKALLERIIKASSNEGDVVLDAYCGCGTTVAVAQELNRKWIGIDITYQSIALVLKRLEESYGKEVLNAVQLDGVPKDFESAVQLANRKDDRTRKEFEKWAVLTYAENRATINEKKGGDGGIDGRSYTWDRDEKGKEEGKKVLFSVKSAQKLTPAVIRELNGTIEKEQAVAGIFITLYDMPNLVKESIQYGFYKNKWVNRDFPKISVVSIQEILKGERIKLPVFGVLKSSVRKFGDSGQLNMLSE